MKQPIFKTGLLLLFIVLLSHLYNNRHGLPIPVVDNDSRLLIQLMKSYFINFFGNYHTLDQVIRGYDLTWALFILFVFFVSLASILNRYNWPHAAKTIALLNSLLWAGCTITAFVFWSWPQQLLFGSLSACFLLSYLFDFRIKTRNTRVCIIGGGISGLTAAYQLQKQGYTNITLLEKDDHVGGKCTTSNLQQQPFDLGGHEMLAGYRDLLNIAKELKAPTKLSIPPLVYDRDKKQYLNFKKAATISGKYTLGQVMIASLKYLWLTSVTFRRFSQPSTGYGNMPEELKMPLDQWLEKRKLTALTDILGFVIKVQGYGQFSDESAAHLVKFMGRRNWLSLILSGMGISKKWPRVMVLGMDNLCERMANSLFDVRVNINVQKIIRDPSKQKGGVQIYWEQTSGQTLEEDNNPMIVDKLVIATPLEPSDTGYLDLTDEERNLFAQIEHYGFYTTICKVQGLPAGVVASIPFNDIKAGEYTGYIKDYTSVPVASFFTLDVTGNITGTTAIDEIKQVLTRVPPYQNKRPQVLEVIEQKQWKYFPHFSTEAAAKGAYDQLERLQGKNNTFYASSLCSFECVGNSSAYAKRLVTRNF